MTMNQQMHHGRPVFGSPQKERHLPLSRRLNGRGTGLDAAADGDGHDHVLQERLGIFRHQG